MFNIDGSMFGNLLIGWSKGMQADEARQLEKDRLQLERDKAQASIEATKARNKREEIDQTMRRDQMKRQELWRNQDREEAATVRNEAMTFRDTRAKSEDTFRAKTLGLDVRRTRAAEGTAALNTAKTIKDIGAGLEASALKTFASYMNVANASKKQSEVKYKADLDGAGSVEEFNMIVARKEQADTQALSRGAIAYDSLLKTLASGGRTKPTGAFGKNLLAASKHYEGLATTQHKNITENIQMQVDVIKDANKASNDILGDLTATNMSLQIFKYGERLLNGFGMTRATVKENIDLVGAAMYGAGDLHTEVGALRQQFTTDVIKGEAAGGLNPPQALLKMNEGYSKIRSRLSNNTQAIRRRMNYAKAMSNLADTSIRLTRPGKAVQGKTPQRSFRQFLPEAYAVAAKRADTLLGDTKPTPELRNAVVARHLAAIIKRDVAPGDQQLAAVISAQQLHGKMDLQTLVDTLGIGDITDMRISSEAQRVNTLITARPKPSKTKSEPIEVVDANGKKQKTLLSIKRETKKQSPLRGALHVMGLVAEYAGKHTVEGVGQDIDKVLKAVNYNLRKLATKYVYDSLGQPVADVIKGGGKVYLDRRVAEVQGALESVASGVPALAKKLKDRLPKEAQDVLKGLGVTAPGAATTPALGLRAAKALTFTDM